MNKALSKAIIQRTKLRNKFLKDPSAANKFFFNKHRNWYISLLRKEKIKYFANLNEKDITDNKKFWQIIKPFPSEKTKSTEKVALIENENLVSDDTEVACCLNFFFSKIVKKLEIPKYEVEDDLHLNMNSHPTLFPSGVFVIRFQVLLFLALIKIQF